jgi:hypothetical protein
MINHRVFTFLSAQRQLPYSGDDSGDEKGLRVGKTQSFANLVAVLVHQMPSTSTKVSACIIRVSTPGAGANQ